MVLARRWQTLIEIGGIFAIFFIQGGWSAPSVNEPYYLGKAAHFWNHAWAPGDFFLETADAHTVFYWTFGWLSLWLPLPALAWVGRLLTWGLLAWAWQRLSTAVVPRPWYSILTAGLLVLLVAQFHMAGEWIIGREEDGGGGVEAKGFAYVLALLALAALVRGAWNRAWLFSGAATSLHVLVGGWTMVAIGWAWLVLGRGNRPTLRSLTPALAGAGVLALPGLIPALLLNRGVDHATIDAANQIYVFDRLGHHLDFVQIAAAGAEVVLGLSDFVVRFLLLCLFWGLLCWRGGKGVGSLLPGSQHTERSDFEGQKTPDPFSSVRRLMAFVGGALLIAALGVALERLCLNDPAAAARWLRLYWFRLSDVAVPWGVALVGAWLIAHARHPGGQKTPDPFSSAFSSVPQSKNRLAGLFGLLVAILSVGFYLEGRLERGIAGESALPDQSPYEEYWAQVCDWIVQSGKIAPDARFITPMEARTFKWRTGRAEVVNWKEIPQDARGIVAWWDRLLAIHASNPSHPEQGWYHCLAERDPAVLRQLGQRYRADYLLTFATPRLKLKRVYVDTDRVYAIYRLD